MGNEVSEQEKSVEELIEEKRINRKKVWTYRYVLALTHEGRTFSEFDGYWNGKVYYNRQESEVFPGVIENKYDKRAKNYTSLKRAENGVEKLKNRIDDYRIEIIPIEWSWSLR